MMSTLKLTLGTIAFVIVYELIDRFAGLIPAWVGYMFLFGIITGLIRLIFKILKEANK